MFGCFYSCSFSSQTNYSWLLKHRITINLKCLQPPLHYQESPGLWAFADKQTAHLTSETATPVSWTLNSCLLAQLLGLQQWRYADLRVSKLRSATFYDRPGSTSPRTRDSRASTLHELGVACWCWCCWKGGTSTHESELCSFVSDVDVNMRSHFQPLSAKVSKETAILIDTLVQQIPCM